MAQPVSTYPDLAGKVAAVAGGSGGIGAATRRLLATNGAKVAVNGRDEAKIGAVVDESRSEGGQASGVGADVTDFAAIERMRRRVEGELGPVDVLAAFAAGGPPPGPVKLWAMVGSVLRGVLQCRRPARRGRRERALPGRIRLR